MKRNVWLTVHGEQQYEGMSADSSDLRVRGTMEETRDGYLLRYEETDGDGKVTTATRLALAPDCIILPGTKNTVDDLLWLRQCGLETALLKLAAKGTPVLGVCGGYQMLGQTLDDSEGSESGRPQTLRGLGLLPTRTVFSQHKRRAQVRAVVTAAPFAGAELEAYEIHTGVTETEGEPFARYPDGGREGCVQRNVFGTYLHGLFDTGTLTEALAGWLCRRKGIDPSDAALIPMEEYRRQQFDKLADGVRAALDMDAVYAAMGMEKH